LELVISAIVLGEPARELRAELVALTASASGRIDLPDGAQSVKRRATQLSVRHETDGRHVDVRRSLGR